MSLTKCIKKAGKALSPDDITFLKDVRQEMIDGGSSAKDAEIGAVKSLIEDWQTSHDALAKQIEEAGGKVANDQQVKEAAASLPKTEPKESQSETEPETDSSEKEQKVDLDKQEPKTEEESPLTQKGVVIVDKAAEKFQDFGEVLGGAKKHTFSFKEILNESVDIKAVPLSESFPKPDYEKMAAEGVPVEALAFVAQLRAHIPTKPRASHKIARWADTVKKARDAAQEVMAITIPVSEWLAGKVSQTQQNIADIVSLAKEILPSQIESLGKYAIDKQHYPVFRGEENVNKWTVYNAERTTSTMGKSEAYFNTKEEALAYIKGQVTTVDANNKPVAKFDIWSEHGKEGVFVGKKLGARKYIELAHFDKTSEAREYIATHNDELVALLNKKKHIGSERRAEQNERIGKDYRRGKNVTSDLFAETFGFRGVQFGNYVENDKRQQDINNAYDGLLDLAGVLNIPPKALSLNGQLGLAFGARGSGGKDAAAAHYEPSMIVINLTKDQGAGSLAHELWHAIDHYFAQMDDLRAHKKDEAPFMTVNDRIGYKTVMENGRPTVKKSEPADFKVREEVYQAFKNIVSTIKKDTNIVQRAQALDNRKTKDYWTTMDEVTARSFERYVIDKLAKDGYESDYLATILSKDEWDAVEALFGNEGESYPYPTNAESEVIHKAYQNLFDTLKTKETDEGNVILFSKSAILPKGAAPKGISVKHVENIAADFLKKYYGAEDGLEVWVYATQDAAFGSGSRARDGEVKAGYYPDRNLVALVASNLDSTQDTVETLQHEILVHKGLGLFAPDVRDRLIQSVLENAPQSESLKPIWERIQKDYYEQSDRMKAEEVIAAIAERKLSKLDRFINRILIAFRKALTAIGWAKPGISNRDLLEEIYKMGQAFMEGQRADPRFDLVDQRMDSRSQPPSPEEQQALEKLGLAPKQARTLAAKIKTLIDTNWNEAISNMGDRAYEGVFDGMVGMKRAEDAVGITDFGQSGYIGARLATGVADVMNAVLHKGAPVWQGGVLQYKQGTRGLLEIFGDLKGGLNNWLAWMGAKRGEELMAQGRENNLTQDDIDLLLTKADGKEALFEQVRQDYIKLNKAMLDVAEQAGLIKPDSRQKWESEYYVPFYRMSEVDNDAGSVLMAPRTKRGLSHQSAGIKALRGGEIATNDLLENILTNWIKLTDASMKNSALLKTVDNLSGSDYLTNETLRFTRAIVPKSEVNKRIKADRGYKEMVANFLGEGRDASTDELINELAKLDNEGFEQLWAMVAPAEKDIIRVQREGKNEYYRVNDPALLRAMVHMSQMGSQDLITRSGRYLKRLLTTGVTAAPDFMLRNFIRDAVHAWAINPDGFKFGKDSLKGFKDAMKEDQDFWAMGFAGASFQGGYVHGTDPEGSAQIMRRALERKGLNGFEADQYMDSLLNAPHKLKNTLQRGWQSYRHLGDKVENANRLATFKAAIKAGKPLVQAAYESKDLMDYSLRGNFVALQWFTDVIPFLNARLQGLSKLGRAMKANPKRVLLQAGLRIALFSVALAMLNDDDDRYKALQDWDKDANWHFWIFGDHYRIPKPFEIGIIFGSLVERLVHVTAGSQEADKLRWSIMHNLFQTLNINPIPQGVMPIAEVVANRSFFFDTPIEGMSDEGKLTEARYNEHTSSTMKELGAIGKWVGLSPKELEHLYNGYLGTIGAYALSLVDVATNWATDRTERPEMKLEDFPVIKSFYKGDSPPRSTQYITDLYDRMTEVDQIYRTINEYKKEGLIAEAKELQKENRDKLKYRKALNGAREQLSDINKKISVVSRADYSAEIKRLQLDKLQVKKNEITKRVAELTETEF